MNNLNNVNNTDVMPLLMNFTTPSVVEDGFELPFTYDDATQMPLEMRTVGTRCLRHHGTTRRNGKVIRYSDPKNETDDSKIVR